MIVFGSTEKVTVKDVGKPKSVALLGNGRKIQWAQRGHDVEIEMPLFRQGMAPSDHALVFKMCLD